MKPSPWAVTNLWSAREANKCTAAIVDTVLISGDPRWMYTSKNGEVSKKRACTGDAVRERFLKLLETTPPGDNPLRRVAVLRFGEGMLKIVDETAFTALMTSWPPREAGLEALQAYVPAAGAAGTVYRNSYRVVSDTGRTTTATHSFATVPPSLAHTGNVVSDGKAVQTLSRAAKLNGTLDAATRSVVRFLEGSQKV